MNQSLKVINMQRQIDPESQKISSFSEGIHHCLGWGISVLESEKFCGVRCERIMEEH